MNDLRKLEMSDDLSEYEEKEKDAENGEVEENEDKTGVKAKLQKGTAGALKYTADCLRAQQALLEHTTDEIL